MGKRYDQLDLDDRIEISRLHAAGTSRLKLFPVPWIATSPHPHPDTGRWRLQPQFRKFGIRCFGVSAAFAHD